MPEDGIGVWAILVVRRSQKLGFSNIIYSRGMYSKILEAREQEIWADRARWKTFYFFIFKLSLLCVCVHECV